MNQKGFIKDIVIIVLAILLLGGGYFYFSKNPAYAPAENTNQNQIADETKDWKTYRNEKYEIEFRYPKSSDVIDQSFFQNAADFQVDVSYDLLAGGYEPARLTISNVADSRYQIVSVKTVLFTKNNNIDGENPIYFYKDNRKVYANCVDYGGLDILDFCNKVLSTFKFTK